jgi:hypothetical protein
MTGVAVRDTQFASWIDPDAWMETMKGSKWNAVLDEEESIVHEFETNPAVRSRLPGFRAMYDVAKEANVTTIRFQSGHISVNWMSQFFKTWTAPGSDRTHTVRDLQAKNDQVWCTQDVGDGAEDFELQYWRSGSDASPSWIKHPVGSDVGVLGSRLFYLGVRNKLQYYQLLSCDATTGKDVKIHYTEQSLQAVLAIERHGDERLILLREDAQDVTVYEITGSGTLLRRKERWAHPSSWILPIGFSYGIDFCWPRAGYLITKDHGQRTLWHCGSKQSAKKLLSIQGGDIQLDPWAVWEGRMPCIVSVVQPDRGTAYYKLEGTTLELLAPVTPTGLKSRRFEARSRDGTPVFGILTYKAGQQLTKLLMVGYGAYGMATSIGNIRTRWAPLVESGWCVGYTFLRGGGDHTESWANAGRLEGRRKTVDDFRALVYAAQRELRIPSSKTAIYGRSAGGLLMGEMLRQDPEGKLFRAIYTEVPYVDELRTTTNPDLPLTALEYNEFGNPIMRLEDFLHVGLTSPADSASVLTTPNTFVLVRTAEHDSQVFTYESLKWIRRLRANAPAGAPKLCIVERGQGHFTPPDVSLDQWTRDCAILDAWVSSNGVR